MSLHASVIQQAQQAEAELGVALQAARQSFGTELGELQARLAAEEDLGSLPGAVACLMQRFKTACEAACIAFAQRTTQVSTSTRARETLDIFS